MTSLLYPGWVHKAGLGAPAPLPESHQPQEGRFPLRPPGSSTGKGPLPMAGQEAPPAPALLLHPGRGTTGSIAVVAAAIHCLRAAPRAPCTHPRATAPSLGGKCLAITIAPRVPPAPSPHRGDLAVSKSSHSCGLAAATGGGAGCEDVAATVENSRGRVVHALAAQWPPIGCLSLA